MSQLNELEKALLDGGDDSLDFYLEITPTAQIRADIEQLRRRAANTTPAGALIESMQALLDQARENADVESD